MNSQNGSGWPPSNNTGLPQLNAENQNQNQQRHLGNYAPGHPVHQGTPSLGAPSIISQSGPYYGGQPSTHSLPAPVGLAHGSPLQAGRVQPSSQQQHSPTNIQQHHQLQGQGFTLPSLGTTLQQAQRSAPMDLEREQAEREREREMELDRHRQAIARSEYERDLEAQEQQSRQRQEHRELHQSPLINHAGPLQIAQPTPRMTSTLHGPNGILNHQNLGPNPLPGVNASSTNAPGGPGPFTNGTRPSETSPRAFAQHVPPTLAQQQQMLGFANANNAGQQQVPTGLAASLTQGGQQPILTDALSYLDQVKVRFVDQPDVYNQFLDIMKDFKSQAIDTPGVINRVSTLFAGHPELIEGFNTFLPPGYAIKCGVEGENSIRVTTPQGTRVTTMANIPSRLVNGQFGAPGHNGMPPQSMVDEGPGARIGWQNQQDHGDANGDNTYTLNRNGAPSPYQGRQGPEPSGPMDYDRDEQVSAENALLHQREQQGVNELTQATSMAMNGATPRHPNAQALQQEHHQSMGRATPLMNNAGQSLAAAQYGQERKGPVEFNHAIGYVNKIKTRYQAFPDIYKSFLEILQTYQKESKPIGDVYAQVTSLFADAPDLLQDFKQFLPESAAQAKASQAAAAQRASDEPAVVSNTRGEPSYAQGQLPVQAHTPRPEMKMPPVGNFAPPPSVGKENKKRRGGAGSQVTGGAAAPDPVPGPIHRGDRGPGARGGPASKKPRVEPPRMPVPEVVPVSPTLVPSLPRPMPPTNDGGSRADDLAFFDKVKKLLSNKTTYNEFLKLCNMYSQDILDENTLKQKMNGFIGTSNELRQAIKRFFPQTDPLDLIENRPSKEGKQVKLSSCRGLGGSYRLVPVAVRSERCGGRDEMCKSVLNDEWTSFPTWASEDSGFIAHRKNVFEEAIHRCEEERHDYDHNIEACQKTLQVMEQVLQHIRTLNPEEEALYRFPRPMGGLSEAIWQRVIKKIYGRAYGDQVIEALFSQPAKVMPILIWRLREKLEEWKTSYREWDKVWREQTMKLFYRSLDHQILTSKSLDKRQFQPKTLQGEVSIKLQQQQRYRLSSSFLPNYQLSHEFNERDVIYDASHLVLTFLRHDSGSVVGEDSRTEQFIKTFIPTFFDLDQDDFASRMSDIDEDTPVDEDSDEALATTRGAAPITNGLSSSDGTTARNKDSKESTPAEMDIDVGRPSAEDTPTDAPRRVDPAEYRWTEHAPITTSDGREIRVNEPFPRDTFTLYANANIFCFFRLFQMLCERLSHIKATEPEVHEDVRRANVPKAADELGINDKPVSAYFYDDTPNANFYKQVVIMCEDVIKGKLEMPDLEETLRRFYIQKGWQLQSFRQLLSAMARYASLIITSDSKDKSLDIVNLFYRDREKSKTTHEAELTYRKQVEKLAKEGDIYRITYNATTHLSTTQLLRRDALTFDYPSLPSIQRWQAYVASYQMLDVTEGIDLSLLQYPLLKRNLPSSLAALIPSSMGISIGNNGSTGNGKEKELTATAAAGKEREREKEKATAMTMGTEEEAALNETWKPQMNDDGLAVRVGQGRYKMEYVDGTSDWFVHGRIVRLRGVVHKSGDATEDVTAAEETPDASPTNVSATPAKVTANEGGGQDQQRPSPPSFTSPPGQSAAAVASAPATNDPGPQSAQPSSSSSSSSLPLPPPSYPPTTVTTTTTTTTTDNPTLRTFLSEFVNRDRTVTISQDAAAGNPTGTVISALEPEKLRNVTEEWERVLGAL